MNFEIKSTFKNFDFNKTSTWLIATVLTAIFSKWMHSVSDTDHLVFLLKPISYFIELFFNTKGVYESTGFHFPAFNICIDKSCSGANFLILAFCVFSSIAPYYLLNTYRCALLFTASIALAYGLTILVNTSRIVTAILLLPKKAVFPWIAHPLVHEAQGAFIYLSALILSYLIIKNGFIKLKNHYAKPVQPEMAVIY